MLGKQGKLVFHASAIETGSGALVFMGISGRGKSTLAASFATNGFRFLTDDGLTVEEGNSRYQVQPSHPSIRLWQDSQEALVAADVVDLDALKSANLIARDITTVKVFASGKIDKAVTVKGIKVTKGARAAIEAAGGKVEE